MRRALFFRYGLIGLLIAGTMILLVTAALSHSPFDLFPDFDQLCSSCQTDLDFAALPVDFLPLSPTLMESWGDLLHRHETPRDLLTHFDPNLCRAPPLLS